MIIIGIMIIDPSDTTITLLILLHITIMHDIVVTFLCIAFGWCIPVNVIVTVISCCSLFVGLLLGSETLSLSMHTCTYVCTRIKCMIYVVYCRRS